MPAGRPSEFSDAIADEICERLSDGESLRSICLADHMPNKSTVFRWLATNKTFCDQYANARDAQADVLADEIIYIADGKRLIGDEDKADVNRDRLSVDARKWAASKLKPKVYGDKTLIGSDPENPLPSGFDVRFMNA